MPLAFWIDRSRRRAARKNADYEPAARAEADRSALPAALAHVPDTQVAAALAACRLTQRGYPPARVSELTGVDPELAELIARVTRGPGKTPDEEREQRSD